MRPAAFVVDGYDAAHVGDHSDGPGDRLSHRRRRPRRAGCAHRLVVAGRSVHVLEAEESPGGRARTVWHRGRPVDRGFQVIFRAYPRTRELAAGDRAAPARPAARWRAARCSSTTARHAALGRRRGWALPRFSGLAAAPTGRGWCGSARRWWRGGRPTSCSTTTGTLGDDRGATCASWAVSDDGASRAFFRPALRRDHARPHASSADPGYFRFLMSMLVRGPAVIPSDGLGMMAEWTSAAVRQAGRGGGARRARVEALETDPEGRRVVGVRDRRDGRAGAPGRWCWRWRRRRRGRCWSRSTPRARRGCPRTTPRRLNAAFALRRPLYRGRSILLNADAGGPRRRRGWTCCARRATSRARARRRGRTSCWRPA